MLRIVAAATIAAALSSTRAASQEAVAERTRAATGARVGALAGGLVASVGAGLLSAGLCDAADCGGSFAAGAAAGLLVGGTIGGAGGAIIGAAIPVEGRRAGGRRWTLRAGMRTGPPGDIGPRGTWARAAILDATTRSVRVGFEAVALGGFEERPGQSTEGRRENTGVQRRDRYAWMAGLIATRGLGSHPEAGRYVLASVGVYTVHEAVSFLAPTPAGEPPSADVRVERSVTPYPGVGVGLGAVRSLVGSLGLGVEARLHLIAGLGSRLALPVLSLEAGLEIG